MVARRELYQLVRLAGGLRWVVRGVEPFDSATAAERFATSFGRLYGRIGVERVRFARDGRIIGRELLGEVGASVVDA